MWFNLRHFKTGGRFSALFAKLRYISLNSYAFHSALALILISEEVSLFIESNFDFNPLNGSGTTII
jgi:hypothetical protein